MAFFPSLKHNFAYHSSKVSSCPDCIFEIPQLWQSGFRRVYSNCCCSCSFEREIIKIGQSSHNIYSNNILNFQESKTILNSCTKKVRKFIQGVSQLLEQSSSLSNLSCWLYSLPLFSGYGWEIVNIGIYLIKYKKIMFWMMKEEIFLKTYKTKSIKIIQGIYSGKFSISICFWTGVRFSSWSRTLEECACVINNFASYIQQCLQLNGRRLKHVPYGFFKQFWFISKIK